MVSPRQWTIYIAQDKHLDYNWCGTRTEIEVRMASLLDGYLTLAEEQKCRWNMDCTWWYDVYQRHRPQSDVDRLIRQFRNGALDCAANIGVLLWGLLNTELSIAAFYKSLQLTARTGCEFDTALVEENPAMPWSVAGVLSACGIPYLGRGIYDLRAKSYAGSREPFPLYWWEAPDGQRVLVHWDMYADTGSWGGYAEAFQLAKLAGEQWDALTLQTIGDRNTPEVYAKRVEFINHTIARYEGYGDLYPVSSILLLGTGWDNWVVTDDYGCFISRFNAESDGRVRLVDALYRDYFHAVEIELEHKGLKIPVVSGTYGIAWEEWAAHLAGPTRDFRQASRLLVHARAQRALDWMAGETDNKSDAALVQALDACLRFAEHDFGGVDRRTAAISAGVRAAAAMEANTLLQALSPVQEPPLAVLQGKVVEEAFAFKWRDWDITFAPERHSVISLRDEGGWEWLPQNTDLSLGTFLHPLYREEQLPDTILPDIVPQNPQDQLYVATCRRAENGIQVRTTGARWGFEVTTRWFFHIDNPWIDIVYDLANGWTESPQSVQLCFPFTLPDPEYTYDLAGVILKAGPVDKNGHDLPGANPQLYAMQNYAQISSSAGNLARSVILLSPDAPLVQFGTGKTNIGGIDYAHIPAAIVSMPMMNLTRNDWQFNQGGQDRWQFRYRLVLCSAGDATGNNNPLSPLAQAQHFGIPPFLQMPGEPPVIAELADFDINFSGGPVTVLKISEDGARVILRLWNVQAFTASGSCKLLPPFTSVAVTDALERHKQDLKISGDHVVFEVPAWSLLTLAFSK